MNSPEQIHQTGAADSKACPNCHSGDTRSVQNIYDIAKNYSRSSISRVAVTGGAGFYLDGSNVRPTPETLMAAKFPPPKRPRFSWWTFISVVITAGFFYFVLVEWVGMTIWPALGITVFCIAADFALQRLILQKSMKAYREEFAAWQKQRVCLSCETAY
jgi:hypothetical protein